MTDAHHMEDVVCFMTSLEMLEKFPHIPKKEVEKLKSIFYQEYYANVKWKTSPKQFNKRMREKRKQILDTLLDKDSRRGIGVSEKIIVMWNAAYLKRKLGN